MAWVALGATAAQALFGRAFKVTKQCGKPLATRLAAHGIATVHPSSILRAPDEESRRLEYRVLTMDLEVAAKLMRDG